MIVVQNEVLIDHVTLTLKLVGIVACGVGNLPSNFGVYFVIDLSANTCQMHQMTLRP